MRPWRSLLLLIPLAVAAEVTGATWAFLQGPLVDVAFTPENNFKGELDLTWASDDELFLTAAVAMRDGRYPVYSLAVADRTRCSQIKGASSCTRDFPIRIVRVASGTSWEDRFRSAGTLLGRLERSRATTRAAIRRVLSKGGLEWKETDLLSCPGAYEKLEEIRQAPWHPDVHIPFQSEEDRQVWMHPTMIKVRMTGDLTTSRYEGHIFRPLPEAVEAFVETLEPCWKQAKSRPPWRR